MTNSFTDAVEALRVHNVPQMLLVEVEQCHDDAIVAATNEAAEDMRHVYDLLVAGRVQDAICFVGPIAYPTQYKLVEAAA